LQSSKLFLSFNKPDNYFSFPRRDLLTLFPKGKISSVLEIGCGTGETGQILRQEYGVQYIVGVDVETTSIELARERLDNAICADIEKAELPFAKESFELILLADIIEHLVNPWNVLKMLREYLSSNGLVLISIPNIQHWRNIVNLILGRWEYSGSGMMDVTHLRFFTRKSIKNLLHCAGFEIVIIEGNSGRFINFLNKITLRIFSSYLSFRFFILARRENS
jgi:SAM-dependent methyltransferase